MSRALDHFICKHPECGDPITLAGIGYCAKHELDARRNGDAK